MREQAYDPPEFHVFTIPALNAAPYETVYLCIKGSVGAAWVTSLVYFTIRSPSFPIEHKELGRGRKVAKIQVEALRSRLE